MNPISAKWHATLPIFFLFFCIRLSAQPIINDGETLEYDYSQTELIVFYGEEGHVYLGPVFEQAAPGMGALVYEMILLYVAQFQDIIIPPTNPTHVIDLLMKDRSDTRRIGQRLYLGDAWLSDGKSIAFLKPEDYRHLAGLLHERYKGAGSDVYRPELLADMQRPTEDELPEDWLPGPDSVAKAIARMRPSDFEYDGYDPGALIRRKAGQTPDSLKEKYTEFGEDAVPAKRADGDAPSKTQQSTSAPHPNESGKVKNNSPEPPVATPQQNMPHRQVPSDGTPLAGEKETKGEPNQRVPFVALAGLATLLSAWILFHNKKREI